jgi:diadenosine tetraphosphatase ApaH/serine/threonine PP2A family protein phosphatase
MREGRGLRAAAWLAAAMLALAGCASQPRHPDAFSFAVLGDTPYSEAEEVRYREMLQAIDRLPLAFVIHVGDFHGATPCSDALFEKRRREFAAAAHPFIYTPGDNEWADCRGARRGNMDPLERLARIREVFFRDRGSLGQRRIEMLAQDQCIGATAAGCRCPAHPENRFWSHAGVRFVTLHVVGSDNNFGVDAASDAEVRCRDEANALWLEQALRASERSQTRALVIAMQANPWYSKRPVYDALIRQMQDAARRLRKPVLLVHGHTHTQRVDAPFTDSLGNTVAGITRMETYGSPFVGWVRVNVDPDDPEVFTFEPRLQAFVPPLH